MFSAAFLPNYRITANAKERESLSISRSTFMYLFCLPSRYTGCGHSTEFKSYFNHFNIEKIRHWR